MEELFVTLFGCALLLLPLAFVAWVYTLSRRVADQGEDLRRLRLRLEELESFPVELPVPGGEGHGEEPGPVEVAPAVAPPPPPVLVDAPPAPAREEPAPLPPPPPPEPPPPAESAAGSDRAGWLEELFGGRVLVWVGAVALSLGVVFLVRDVFGSYWQRPEVRVATGVLLGLSFLTVGERLRRSAAAVAAGASAAGIAALFVSFYALTTLYELVPPLVGFALMGLTAVVAVGLALRQGPIVAVLGLVGGFLTPYLVASENPEPGLLFLYLLLLELGVFALARRRGWWLLAAGASLAGFLWVAVWAAGADLAASGDSRWLGLFVLASTLAVVVALLSTGDRPGRGGGDAPLADEAFWRFPSRRWLAGGAAFVGMGVLALVVGRAGYGTEEWIYLGLLALGCLVLARVRPAYLPVAGSAVAFTGALLGLWGWWAEGAQRQRFLLTLAVFGLLYAVFGWWSARSAGARGSSERHHAWSLLSAASLLGALLLGAGSAWRTEWEDPFSWGVVAVAVAALAVVALLPFVRRRDELGSRPVASYAVAATVAAALAVPLELERAWLTVGWALEVPVLVWLARRLRLRELERLALVLAASVTLRLVANPEVAGYDLGDHPVWSWLLWGYGVPALALAAGAVLSRRGAREAAAETLAALAAAVAVAWAALLVRQLFHPGNLTDERIFVAEWGWITGLWLALAVAFVETGRRRAWRALPWMGRATMGLALLAVAAGPWLVSNPAWAAAPVGGTPLFNQLLWGVGLPALLFGVYAATERRREEDDPHPHASRLASRLAVVAALVGLFLFVTLEVRQVFRGSDLARGTASAAEQYAYSAAWVCLAVGLLVTGLLVRRRWVRLAALGVMTLAVVKVFLFDMASLADTFRVLSFLGLGASLLLLAWIYKRFVLVKEDGDASA